MEANVEHGKAHTHTRSFGSSALKRARSTSSAAAGLLRKVRFASKPEVRTYSSDNTGPAEDSSPSVEHSPAEDINPDIRQSNDTSDPRWKALADATQAKQSITVLQQSVDIWIATLKKEIGVADDDSESPNFGFGNIPAYFSPAALDDFSCLKLHKEFLSLQDYRINLETQLIQAQSENVNLRELHGKFLHVLCPTLQPQPFKIAVRDSVHCESSDHSPRSNDHLTPHIPPQKERSSVDFHTMHPGWATQDGCHEHSGHKMVAASSSHAGSGTSNPFIRSKGLSTELNIHNAVTPFDDKHSGPSHAADNGENSNLTQPLHATKQTSASPSQDDFPSLGCVQCAARWLLGDHTGVELEKCDNCRVSDSENHSTNEEPILWIPDGNGGIQTQVDLSAVAMVPKGLAHTQSHPLTAPGPDRSHQASVDKLPRAQDISSTTASPPIAAEAAHAPESTKPATSDADVGFFDGGRLPSLILRSSSP
ncbi:hypothetical protein BU26DRAFT_586462 [Trematosphaeria pertusa]|uniref:Uncharacterized protein n=1 Tax=Trematosphaeria pertusa TaxID=390896 RepID=A0A6A6HSV9_9PLEO|nr:uncharacterized protein BU26DRAFT_586462 [Trematosphaeria pertusa]KAF2241274.1 hypothetical protein BU26DRAFT_586462 [Trematosphaeria pertusa]